MPAQPFGVPELPAPRSAPSLTLLGSLQLLTQPAAEKQANIGSHEKK